MDNWLQAQRFKKAKKYIRKGDKLLDIGCEKCHFFNYIKDLTTLVSGIDPVDYKVKASLHNDIQIYQGYFPQILDRNDRYDVITMLAVLEHIPFEDQLKVAAGVEKHLNHQGRLIITVPDAQVDQILRVLQCLKLVSADTLNEHYGYNVNLTKGIFESKLIKLEVWRKFQFGLNNLFVFQKV